MWTFVKQLTTHMGCHVTEFYGTTHDVLIFLSQTMMFIFAIKTMGLLYVNLILPLEKKIYSLANGYSVFSLWLLWCAYGKKLQNQVFGRLHCGFVCILAAPIHRWIFLNEQKFWHVIVRRAQFVLVHIKDGCHHFWCGILHASKLASSPGEI